MIYKFEPMMMESAANVVSIDGHMQKEDLMGPFRVDGRVLYYDPSEGKMLNPIDNSYVREFY